MKWQRGYKSADVEDRRGSSGGGGGGRRRGRGVKMGAGGIIIGLLALVVFGKDIFGLTGQNSPLAGGQPAAKTGPAGRNPKANQETKEFLSFVLDDIQNTWQKKLPGYQRAKLVLFSDAVDSGCGRTSAAVGPFYCGADNKAYIDMTFYEELKKRFGAPGDFAQAYVLAHEIGHHVQNITGTSAKVRKLKRRNPRDKNRLSVRQELQADCYAGVWAHSTQQRDLLDKGDIEEGLRAAAAIGDDRLQKMAGKKVNPHAWTHGSSEQRMKWFMRGYKTGNPKECDTFGSDR